MPCYICGQIADECELIAALNARILFGLETEAYDIHSEAHRTLVEQFGMSAGPFPLISEGYRSLGLKTRDILPTAAAIIDNITERSCVIGTLYDSTIGWHAMCIAKKRGNYVLVLNTDSLPLLRNRRWIEINELISYSHIGPKPPNSLLHWKVVTKL